MQHEIVARACRYEGELGEEGQGNCRRYRHFRGGY
jgi:hypothetical protein